MTRGREQDIPINATASVIREGATATEVEIAVSAECPANNISAGVPEDIDGHARAIIGDLLNGYPSTRPSRARFRTESGYIDFGDSSFTATIGDVGELHNRDAVAVLDRLRRYCVSHLILPTRTGLLAPLAIGDMTTHHKMGDLISINHIRTAMQSAHIQ